MTLLYIILAPFFIIWDASGASVKAKRRRHY